MEKHIVLDNPTVNRVWFITDTHLGLKNNSDDWIKIMHEYFHGWFIPLVRANYKKGDILMHLGDVYDSRQSINLKVLNLGIEVFEILSSIFSDGIYIIIGNHDIWGKATNDINSLKSLKWIPNVNIIEEPLSIKFNNKNFMLMPWRKNTETEGETLDNTTPHDILCCHCDIRGLKFNRYSDVEKGQDKSMFKKFTKVYSGHIHYAQKIDNISMLGSPYQITRADMDNTKSITLLNLSDMKEIVFVNDFSPRYIKIDFEDILEATPAQLNNTFNNNFIDVMIDPAIALKAPLNILTDLLTTQRSLSFHPQNKNEIVTLSQRMMDPDNKQFDVLDFIMTYVNNLDYSEDVKMKIIKSLSNLHKIVIEQDQDKKLI
jgi:DNA repair exonuclease SbcCD nuclease subunit